MYETKMSETPKSSFRLYGFGYFNFGHFALDIASPKGSVMRCRHCHHHCDTNFCFFLFVKQESKSISSSDFVRQQSDQMRLGNIALLSKLIPNHYCGTK
jgi:hypothetical protein